mmetsp:Transcript_27196/g.63338  ORF Transcript_27196/g.63338 Transcript_27196/m.63338 type:complete len:211 (+) Transcript_27196:251-883(+)
MEDCLDEIRVCHEDTASCHVLGVVQKPIPKDAKALVYLPLRLREVVPPLLLAVGRVDARLWQHVALVNGGQSFERVDCAVDEVRPNLRSNAVTLQYKIEVLARLFQQFDLAPTFLVRKRQMCSLHRPQQRGAIDLPSGLQEALVELGDPSLLGLAPLHVCLPAQGGVKLTGAMLPHQVNLLPKISCLLGALIRDRVVGVPHLSHDLRAAT